LLIYRYIIFCVMYWISSCFTFVSYFMIKSSWNLD
jgi:hypothetical protein